MPRTSNTQIFIAESKKIHFDETGNPLFDYCRMNYIDAKTKVIILCKTHGEFQLTPNKHLSRKDGCRKCGRVNSADKQRMTTDEFIKNAKLKHIDDNGESIYDYSVTIYGENTKDKVSIKCKIHGIFEQSASGHLSGNGCIQCRNDKAGFSQRMTNEEFIEQANNIHDNRFGYTRAMYINSKTDVLITCIKHGDFKQRPNNHLNGAGCPECTIEKSVERQRMTTEEFIERAKLIHIDDKGEPLFEYTDTNYGDNQKDKVRIKCKTHDIFEQLPSCHLSGRGCIKCRNDKSAENQRLTFDEFLSKSRQKHGEKCDYSMVDYINTQTNVKIKCMEHDTVFYQTPGNHFKSIGCSKCHKKGYSAKAVSWLDLHSKLYNINIQHAENGNEYLIPNTRLYADGYCIESNTIYEFHGDYWHGNPKKYNPIDLNPTSKTSFGDLYKMTLKREQLIRDMGFNIVTIWETEWNKINRSVIKVQRMFRNSKNSI